MAFISVVLAILVLLVYVYFGTRIAAVGDEALPRESCRSSVIVKANAKIADNAISLNCHTQFVDIKKNGVIKNGNNIDSPLNEDGVKRAIADELYDCWYEFGEGKIQPFGSELLQNKKHCVICSEISFDDATVAAIRSGEIKNFLPATVSSGKLSGFEDWLKNNNVGSFGASGTEQKTFYDYLSSTALSGQGFSTNQFVFNGKDGASRTDRDIDMAKDYSVIFFSYSPSTVIGWTNWITGASAGTVAVVSLFLPPPFDIIGLVASGAMAGAAIAQTVGETKSLSSVLIAESSKFAEVGCGQMF
jgi:hypothetical protein